MKIKLAALALLFPFAVLAADTSVPSWLEAVLDFLVAVPLAGPILLELLKWLGVISASATALATGIMVVANALKSMGNALGFVAFAERVDAIYKLVWPYLSWLSVYNAKRK